MEDIILLGFGGHGKSVIDSIESQGKYHIVGFLEIPEKNHLTYKEYKVIGQDQDAIKFFNQGIKNAFITVGYMGRSTIRNDLYKMLKEIGYLLPTIIDPTAAIAKDVIIGEGSFVGKNAIVNAGANIAKMAIINSGAIIEHECNIEEFTHVAVGAVLCGQVKVGRATLVGANATLLQRCNIGNQVIIAAGTTVLQDIEDNQTYYGKK